jgi:hypothetical protein
MEPTASTKRVTQAELARELGVSRQAVGDLVKRGVLPVGEDGRMDLEESQRILRERVRPSGRTASAAESVSPPLQQVPADAGVQAQVQVPPKAPDHMASYYVAKAAREASEAGIAALKLQQMRDELIDREASIQAAFTAFRQLRNALSFLPRKLSGQLVGVSSPRDIQQRMEDELRKLLDDFQRKTLASMVTRLGGGDQSNLEDGE